MALADLKFFKTLKFPKLGKLHKGFKWQCWTWQQIYRKVADILVCKGNPGGAIQVKDGKNWFVCFNQLGRVGAPQVKGGKNWFVCFNQVGRVGCELETEESKSRVWHGSDPQQSDDQIDQTATHWWSHWSQKWSENKLPLPALIKAVMMQTDHTDHRADHIWSNWDDGWFQFWSHWP